MHKKNSRKLVIQLIKDDLKHQHTVLGLNQLGFKNDNSLLDISHSVFSLMELNINDKRLEHLTGQYCDRASTVTGIPVTDSASFDRLATEIYNWLILERKQYYKLLNKV
jgi:hypothetical protein